MYEGDSDDDALRKRGIDRTFQPNQFYKAKEELKSKVNKAKLQTEKQQARKDLAEKSKKLKDELSNKGVVSADQKMKVEQMMKEQEQQQAAQAQLGTTEQHSQSV